MSYVAVRGFGGLREDLGQCYVEEGDRSSVIAELQKQLNKALDKAGYEAIGVTSVYDKATCGAVFTLSGKFEPEIKGCRGTGLIIPLKCQGQKIPKKKDEEEPIVTPAGMVALGVGLAALLAAAGFAMGKKPKALAPAG